MIIAYGTRKGATRRSAFVLGEELSGTGDHHVRTKDAKEVDEDDFAWADGIVIGSSIIMGRWKRSSKKILKKAGKEDIPVAVFVSAAVTLSQEITDEKLQKNKSEEEPLDRVAYAVRKFIDPVCQRYHIKPFAKTAFGGRLTFFKHEIINNRCDDHVRAWAGEILKALQ